MILHKKISDWPTSNASLLSGSGPYPEEGSRAKEMCLDMASIVVGASSCVALPTLSCLSSTCTLAIVSTNHSFHPKE